MRYKIAWWLITRVLWPPYKANQPLRESRTKYGYKLFNWFTPHAEESGYNWKLNQIPTPIAPEVEE